MISFQLMDSEDFKRLLRRFYFFMAKTRAQKEEAVKNLTEKLQRAKSVVFADYKGMKMNQISDLRNKLAEIDAQFEVTKNTLVLRALTANYYPLPTDHFFDGPTATLFGFGDEILPLKILSKAFKDNQIGEIKGGFLNGEFMEALSMIRLSTLPSKLELQAKVVGYLVSPLSGMINVLQGNLRNLVYALSQIQKMNGGEI